MLHFKVKMEAVCKLLLHMRYWITEVYSTLAFLIEYKNDYFANSKDDWNLNTKQF